MHHNSHRGRTRELRGWKHALIISAALAFLLAASDWAVGRWQQRLIEEKKAYRIRLDRLAFHAVRTGIDDIKYDPAKGYRVRFTIQNAFDEPLYVMMPTVEAFIQVGPQWAAVPVAEPQQANAEGSVVRLVGSRNVDRLIAVERIDYTELIPGYIHMKLTLETYVSPEENPQDEVGERKEDLVIYLKDYRHADDAARHAGRPTFKEKPDFIPLRAWTLVPKTVEKR